MKHLAVQGVLGAALLAMGCEPAAKEHAVSTTTDTSIVTPKVTWPARDQANPRAFAALGDAKDATKLLGRSPVPVLAPTNVELERPTFVVGAEFYTLTGRVSGATISVSGTRAAHRYHDVGAITGDRVLRGNRGFVSVNEGVRTTSWIENGVAYTVDVECANPTEARCTSDSFVVDVIENLAFAGGGSR